MATATGTLQVSLQSAILPGSRANHIIVVRARILNVAHTGAIRAQVSEDVGGTLVPRSNEYQTASLTTSFATYQLPISNSEAATIQNYGNLSLALAGYSSTNDPVQFEIADAYLSVPLASAAPALPTATQLTHISIGAPTAIPQSRQNHVIVVRARKTSSSHSGTVRATLFDGAVQITTGELESTPLTTSFENYRLFVPEASAVNINNYSDLSIKFRGYSIIGDALVIEVSDAWVEVPSASVIGETINKTASDSGAAAEGDLTLELNDNLPSATATETATSGQGSSAPVSVSGTDSGTGVDFRTGLQQAGEPPVVLTGGGTGRRLISLLSYNQGLGGGAGDTGTRTSGPAGIDAIIEYNGMYLNNRSWVDTFIIETIDGIDDSEVRDSREEAPGDDGDLLGNSLYAGRSIVLTGYVYSKHLWKLRDLQSAIRNAFVDINTEYPLIFHNAANPSYSFQIFCKKNQKIQMPENQSTLNEFKRPFQIFLKASNPRFLSLLPDFHQRVFSTPTYDTIAFTAKNQGNYSAQPEWKFIGPINSGFTVINDANNQMMQFNTAIPAGETWVIDVGSKSKKFYRQNDGESLYELLTDDSTLIQIEKDDNPIHIIGAGLSSGSSVEMRFYHSYM
jgi:hypothetical protein